MNNRNHFDELDQAIDQMIAEPGSRPAVADADVAGLLEIVSDLQHLPRLDFKSRLKTELQWVASGRPVSPARPAPAGEAAVMPSLFGRGYSIYPVRRSNFAASAALHATMVLFVGFGLVMVKHTEVVDQPVSHVITLVSPYTLPPSSRQAQGGGGGGEHSILEATHGSAPRFAADQITPPVVELANKQSKLQMNPTVIGSPDLNLPRAKDMGDPLSALASVPSSGVGMRGGIGGGGGGGVGVDRGPGVGPGTDGGIGGGPYIVGAGVSAPKVIYNPDPEYSDEARKAHYQGVVSLLAVIGADGIPRNLRVQQSLGLGLDEKAIGAVRKWRFEPATKGGHPVPVLMVVQVDFRLY